MESVELYLPNINFKVRTLKLYKKDIIKAINDSIIPYKKDSDKYIEIEYMVNKNKYLTILIFTLHIHQMNCHSVTLSRRGN